MIAEKHINVCLGVSLCVTVVLTALLFSIDKEPIQSSPAVAPAGVPFGPTPSDWKAEQSVGNEAESPEGVNWRSLSSLSHRELLNALRHAGLSHALARNIVLGRIDAEYRADLNHLARLGGSDAEIKASFERLCDKIESITGDDWFKARRYPFFEKSVEFAAMDGMQFGHLFPGLWRATDDLIAAHQIQKNTSGGKEATPPLLDDLKRLIGDAAYEEFRLRSFSFSFFDVLRPSKFFPSTLTDPEARAVLEALMPEDFTAKPRERLQSIDAHRLLREKAPKIRDLLGEQKFGAFLKSNSLVFDRSQMADLTNTQAAKLFEMKELLRAEAAALRRQGEGGALPDEIAMHLFFSLESAVLDLLGPDCYRRYGGKTAEWIEELTR